MAITIVRTEPLGRPTNLMFKTTEIDSKMIVTIAVVDDNLKVKSDIQTSETEISEENYHTALRIESAKKKQLITSLSTDPEWNPKDYSRTLEEAIDYESGK